MTNMEQITLEDYGINVGAAASKDDSWIDNDFLLQDRIQKIQQIVGQYGEENFCISFFGGKDSTVLSALIDMALPGNQIPRVYANTGIELNMIRDFVFELAKTDDRIKIIKPSTPIKAMLEREGYPFKSKSHAMWVERYNRIGYSQGVLQYLGEREDKKPWQSQRSCPKMLRYQFTSHCKLNISDKCCKRLKEEPLNKWGKENNKPYAIIGIMRDEGGRRTNAQCLAFKSKKLSAFQPLVPMTKEWEEWFIKTYNVKICDIYYPPYDFVRTGCKGCPFALNLQEELDTLEKYFPNERKQCEIIWAPVYAEYRRLRYRLKPVGEGQIKGQLSLFDDNADGR